MRRRAGFQRVLVALDGGAGGRAGLRAAITLARVTGGRLRLCFVVDAATVHGAATPLLLRGPLRQDQARHGRRVLERARAACRRARVPCDLELREGSVADELVAVARGSRAQLIVLGTEGRGRLVAFLLGPRHTRAVIGRAPCPVLVVPVAARRRGRGAAREPKR